MLLELFVDDLDAFAHQAALRSFDPSEDIREHGVDRAGRRAAFAGKPALCRAVIAAGAFGEELFCLSRGGKPSEIAEENSLIRRSDFFGGIFAPTES